MASSKTKRKRTPKSILKLPDLEQSKSAVLNSLTSPSSQRTYDHAIREFIEWYCSEPRLAFNKTVVTRYRVSLEQRHYASTTINLRLAAVRRLAYPAIVADTIRKTIWSVDPEVSVPTVRALGGIVSDSVANRRFEMDLLLLFTISALFLAGLGVYGVVTYSVVQRQRDLAFGSRSAHKKQTSMPSYCGRV